MWESAAAPAIFISEDNAIVLLYVVKKDTMQLLVKY